MQQCEAEDELNVTGDIAAVEQPGYVVTICTCNSICIICKLDFCGRAVLEHCVHMTVPLRPYDRKSAQQWQALARSAQALLSTALVL